VLKRPYPPTDKADKTPSVSFVSDPRARLSTLYVEPQARPSERARRAGQLIEICRAEGIGLRVTADEVIVQSHGRAWRALVDEIYDHTSEIAELIGE
jgi:hypothetical protein